MNPTFQLTAQAVEDLDAIWLRIAEDNPEAAERVEMEILATCRRLAKHPRIGTKRRDITPLPVRFWTVTKFPNYVIVYAETTPLQVISILHAKRDIEKILERRS
jgi:plasmid stabilization system protein ParE